MARRSDFVEGMNKNMYDWFYEFQDYATPDIKYTQYWHEKPSTAAFDQLTSALGPAALTEKQEGDSLYTESPSEGKSVIVKNRTFGAQVPFTLEAVDDHQKATENAIKDYVKGWVESYKWAREKFYANFFNQGGMNAGHDVFNNTITNVVTDPKGDLCYDGESFFNLSTDVATRLSEVGTGYYNGLADDLNATNLEKLWLLIASTNNRNEGDETIEIIPNVLVVPTALRFTAKRILESEKIPGKADNDINPMKDIVELVVNPYLTDTNAYFLGVKGKGILALDRKAPELRFYRDEKTLDYYASIHARFGGGVKNWRFWGGSNFSTT